MSLFHLVLLAFTLLFILPKLALSTATKPNLEVRAQLIPNSNCDGLVYTGTRNYT